DTTLIGAVNTTLNLQGLLNSTGIYSTYNATYAGSTSWSEAFNTSFDARDNDTSYNATYAAYATNVSKNYTKIVYDNWNTSWSSTYNATYAGYDDTTLIGAVNTTLNLQGLLNSTGIYSTYNATYAGSTSWSEAFNTSFDARDNDTSYNATYAAYATNVSKNYTKIVYDNWNTSWSSTYNATYAGYDDTTLIGAVNTTLNLQGLLNSTGIYSTYNVTYAGSTSWSEAFNTSFDARDNDTSYNATYALYNNTDMLLSVNTTANIQNLLNSTGIYSTYNATYAGSVTWDAAFNTSFDARDNDTSYNATYALYNNTDMLLSVNTTANIQNLLNSTGIYSTYNATYAGSVTWDAAFNTSFDA
ncbi:unnamed protein product, partial [marine sediment metagenome]